MEPVPALVTLHVWRIPPVRLLRVAAHLSMDRHRARRTPGVRFTKLLGTGRGFGVTQADPTRWAKLTCWSAPGPDPVAEQWSSLATETWRVDLTPLASSGRWSRREPFGRPSPSRHSGPVAALTRARLTPLQAAAFWKSVPTVEAELHGCPGLRTALAVGEAPIGLQGTFSVWESAAALQDFAYGSPAHRQAITDTTRLGWYAEELFARFAVTGSEGTLDGQDPLA